MISQSLRGYDSIEKPLNVSYVVKNRLCIGCGVCESICPNQAIRLIFNDQNGISLPFIDEERCNGCQLCLRVCYGFEVDNDLNLKLFGAYPRSIIGNSQNCYTGYATSERLKLNSTSGGVVTALLKYALEKRLITGAIVTKMEAGNHPRAKAFVGTTIDDIISAQGSKYCPVSFAECLKNLKSNERYAIIGLPCHIYGVRKLAEFDSKIRKSVRYYLGILCGGMPSYLGTSYVLRTYHMDKKYITKLEYRGGGWPGRLLIRGWERSSNREVEICVSYPKYWRDSFGFFLPYRCTVCHDGFNEFSDISFGDAWLPQPLKNRKQGTSLIITRTEAGEHLFNAALADKIIQTNSIHVKEAINSQQGIIQFKFVTLRARTNLSKKLRKKLPLFDLRRNPSAKLDGYLSGAWLCLGRTLAHKKNLRLLFAFYVSANSLLNLTRYYHDKIKR